MLNELYRRCRDRLQDAGIEAADYEALCLMKHVTGFDRAGLLTHGSHQVTEQQQQLLEALTEKRITRYPLQYLLKEWEFMGIPLEIGEGVLIPRDDTELCVRLCLDYLKTVPRARTVDLCAGSGAIAIALEQHGGADVTAIELSDRAFAYLTRNTEQNHCHLHPIRGDILDCHTRFADGSLDLIVSNPPYIPVGELPLLQKEVQFEPVMALDGGADGMDFYRAILRDWSRKLKPGGALALELGEHQAEPVTEQMRQQGFSGICSAFDFGGCERAVIGIYQAELSESNP